MHHKQTHLTSQAVPSGVSPPLGPEVVGRLLCAMEGGGAWLPAYRVLKVRVGWLVGWLIDGWQHRLLCAAVQRFHAA